MTRSSGFTLIELLVVMAIVATLAGLGMVAVPYMMRRGEKTAAESFISTLSAALETYQSSEGAYPPTSLKEFPGVGTPNDENSGIESVVICLSSTKKAPFDFSGRQGGKLENLDADQTQAQLTRFGTKDLFEAVDPWGTPFAYFNAQDYGRAGELGKVTLPNGAIIRATPWQDAKVAMAFRPDSFQLISAGPDKVFDTEDDVTNFVRQ